MKLYRLYREINLRINEDDCWAFFSSPTNLKLITPDYMSFDITDGGGKEMYSGQLISYKVSPLMGIKLSWVTEITHIKKNYYFIDEQRFGPYVFWHHKHFFHKINGGMKCIDELHYLPPGGIFSGLINHLMVKNKLVDIFNYRHQKLNELFGEISS